jgi:hypothetical protein
MRSHNSHNHSSLILTKARTEPNKVMLVRRCRQPISINMVPLHTAFLAAHHLSNFSLETKESKDILVHRWAELQNLVEIQFVLLSLVRILQQVCTQRS